MNIIPRLLTFAALVFLPACASQRGQIAPAPVDWPTRAEQIAIGMTRAEVNELLPVWRGPAGALLTAPRITTITGAGTAEVYWVAQDWRVTVIYDHAGGKVSDRNRVAKPVTIEKAGYGSDS